MMRPPPLRLHERHDSLRHLHRSQQVDRDDALPVRRRVVDKILRHPEVARIVDQDVRCTDTIGARKCGCNLARIPDVDHIGSRAVDASGLHIPDVHASAVCQQAHGNRTADTLGAARDERAPAVQLIGVGHVRTYLRVPDGSRCQDACGRMLGGGAGPVAEPTDPSRPTPQTPAYLGDPARRVATITGAAALARLGPWPGNGPFAAPSHPPHATPPRPPGTLR